MTQPGGPGQPPYEPYGPEGAGGATPPGFAPPGQVPTLHGVPLAAPGPSPRVLVAAVAFFGLLVLVGVAGLLFTARDGGGNAGAVRGGEFHAPLVSATPFRPRAPARPSGPVPKPVRYTGTGNKKITVRRPEPGQTLVYVKGSGREGSFVVFALDRAGQKMGLLVNAREAYEGVRLLESTSFLEAHALEIQSVGRWTVELRSARSAKAFTGATSGRGDTVLRYEGRTGTAAIKGGRANALFMVVTHADGFPRLVATSVGAFDGRKPWAAGPALVEVQATGAWSIRVT